MRSSMISPASVSLPNCMFAQSFEAHRPIRNPRVHPGAPSSDQETQRMATEDQHTIYEGPFFGFDPGFVSVIVGEV